MQTTISISENQKLFFETNGYLVVENIIDSNELPGYKKIYDDFLNGIIDVGENRSDLGAGLGDKKKENITQIMWPSDFVPALLQLPYHQKALAVARELLGDDIAMDFDMLINKAPHTNTPTPWHQDAAYWINMPDRRAVSCWMALDPAVKENGCMWYVPGSHLHEIRAHRFAGKQGGALTCTAEENEGIFVELKPGSCVFHHGATLHYSRGNSTDTDRRAFIINYRSQAMIDLEREQGFDHGRTGGASDRRVRNNEPEKK